MFFQTSNAKDFYVTQAQITTQQYEHEQEILLHDGGSLPRYRLAYETWGTLNPDKTNVILLFHALSGSHHAKGYNPSAPTPLWTEELHEGWWEEMIGPGKALDTDEYFIICPNYLGGCYGSTGPASTNPKTGQAYGSEFPHLCVADQALASSHLLDFLGINKLHGVVGPSVGGLCALSFATLYAERVQNVILIASGIKTTILNRLTLFEQIIAIENDPHFCGGDYYESKKPELGLALARMISHKTFVHLDNFERRARKDLVEQNDILSWYKVRDQFQSYMLYQGSKFVKRFDPNTYLRIIDMWSRFNAATEAGCENYRELFLRSKKAGHRYLVFSIDSDFCFYPEEQAEIVQGLESAEVEVSHLTVHSDKGHDSFLLEPHLYSPQIKYLLNQAQ